MPAGEVFTPVAQLVKYFPSLMYFVYFDDKMEKAVAELEGDVRRTLRAAYRSVKNPPPEGFLKSGDALLDAYGPAEVIIFSSFPFALSINLRRDRFLPYHISLLRKRITLSNKSAFKGSETVSLLSSSPNITISLLNNAVLSYSSAFLSN